MKIYKVFSPNVDYDEDEAMIIITSNEQKAMQMARDAWGFRSDVRNIKPLVVEEVDTSKEEIICVAHYGD